MQLQPREIVIVYQTGGVPHSSFTWINRTIRTRSPSSTTVPLFLRFNYNVGLERLANSLDISRNQLQFCHVRLLSWRVVQRQGGYFNCESIKLEEWHSHFLACFSPTVHTWVSCPSPKSSISSSLSFSRYFLRIFVCVHLRDLRGGGVSVGLFHGA